MLSETRMSSGLLKSVFISFVLFWTGFVPVSVQAEPQEHGIAEIASLPFSTLSLPQKSMRAALSTLTGYSLGSGIDEAKRTELRVCAAKMRYGSRPSDKIAQLYCSNRKKGSADHRKFWINFTSPDKGHTAWKIMLTLSGGETRYSGLVEHFTSVYGKPRKVKDPVSYSWQDGGIYLQLKEDQYGYQVELWDRTLHKRR